LGTLPIIADFYEALSVRFNVAVLILAAGGSTRFGSPKQIAYFQGETLVQRCINSAGEVFPNSITVVLGAHYEKIEPSVTGAQIAHNPLWQNGLGGSIAYGIEHIDAAAEAVLILLADQIYISAKEIRLMVEAFNGDNIVAAKYSGARGVPAIFPRSSFAGLGGLAGDVGAKKLLAMTKVPIVEISLPQAAVDIDHVEDLPTQ
jgi:molybdenum cofactor cytidylyltransferase|tara:strand:- start:95 stop:703 length:609 start_codon:yes stop_codon:yes gene_type:complete